MKVRVKLVLDVDEKVWNETYGPNGPVENDVESYILTHIQGSAAVEEKCILGVALA